VYSLASKRRRQAGPMSAAGLISYYEELEGKIKLTPTTVLLIALVFSIIVVMAHLIF